MNTLEKIAAKACIPLECGEAILRFLRTPIKVYMPYIFYDVVGIKNSGYWLGGIFSTREYAQKYSIDSQPVMMAESTGEFYYIDVAEHLLYGYDEKLPILIVLENTPFLTQYRDHAENRIALLKFSRGGYAVPLAEEFLDAKV